MGRASNFASRLKANISNRKMEHASYFWNDCNFPYKYYGLPIA